MSTPQSHLNSRRLANLAWVCAGIFLFYALTNHLIGAGVTRTCHAVIPLQRNFVFELFILGAVGMTMFGMHFLWKAAPFFTLFSFLVLFLVMGYLQNKTASNFFKITTANVETVWRD
jgi:hypothetical protein